MKTQLRLLALVLATAWLVGCGSPGAPLPPSLELPRPVEDLSASRKGNKVFLSWTAPTQTTDGQNIRPSKLGPALICRSFNTGPMTACTEQVGQVPVAEIPVPKPGDPAKRISYSDTLTLPAEMAHATGFATYAVAMQNWRGKNAGLSNRVKVPMAPVVAPPPQVLATVTATAIQFTFTCFSTTAPASDLAHSYRVYRRQEGVQGAVLVTDFPVDRHAPPGTPVSTFSTQCDPKDESFEWEKTYYYHVTPVTTVLEKGKTIAQVEGDDSPEVKVLAHDVFPPARPSGLQAVYSGPGQKPFIDLTWAPNTDHDLAGYDIYRHEQDQQPVKINPALVKTPSYRDDTVQPGHTYLYSVTAVDLRGNQSQRSEETSEAVP